MSKAGRTARIVADAEGRALLAEQAARHAEIAAQDRIERKRLLRDFRAEIQRDRVAQVQADTALVLAEAVEQREVLAQPRDDGGRWLPAAPEPAPAVDPATMSMEQYIAWRSGNRMGGIENLSRRPGVTEASTDGSGFLDWRDMSAGNRVFNNQLADNRRPVPPGFVRQASADQHSEWS